MTVEFGQRPFKISQGKPQMRDLLAREFDHEVILALSVMLATIHVFTGAL